MNEDLPRSAFLTVLTMMMVLCGGILGRVVLFGVRLMILRLGVVVLGVSMSRAKVLTTWAAWPFVVGWARVEWRQVDYWRLTSFTPLASLPASRLHPRTSTRSGWW